MEILSYNVMSGGFTDYSYDLKKPDRLDLIIQVVKQADADFVSLIDTFRWDSFFAKGELSEFFGYEYVYCINLEDERLKKRGHNNGITVLTKIQNIEFETIRIATRNAVKSKLKVDSNMFHLFSLYLDDLSEDTRLEQLDGLKKYIDEPSHSILIGDLNAIKKDHRQLVNERVDKLPRDNSFFEKLKPAIDNRARGDVFDKLQQFTLRDVSQKEMPTFPTPLLMNFENPIVQLDYAFVGKAIKVNDFKVIYNSLTRRASDHFPILFTTCLQSINGVNPKV